MKRLGWTARPAAIHELQAAAAVGQMGLAQAYESQFARTRPAARAQILLTHADLADRERYLNARSTLLTLLALGVIPIINENDTVATDEIKFGDNDTLGALVTNLIEADVLVILTDQAGLYSADPRTRPGRDARAQRARRATRLEAMAGGAGSAIGRGGMLTKVLAAKRAARSGRDTVIAWGREADVLLRAWRPAKRSAPRSSRPMPCWRRASSGSPTTCSSRARVVVDAGAVRALASATARACCRSAWSL